MQSPSQAPPPVPPRRTRDQRPAQKASWNTILLTMLRWVVLVGGLIIIVDLGTLALLQRGGPDAAAELESTNLILNVVLASVLGAVVARQTGLFYLGAVAGFLAAVIDSLMVILALSMAPSMPSQPVAPEMRLLTNVIYTTIPAAVSGLVSRMVERASGPRSR